MTTKIHLNNVIKWLPSPSRYHSNDHNFVNICAKDIILGSIPRLYGQGIYWEDFWSDLTTACPYNPIWLPSPTPDILKWPEIFK